MTFAWIQENVVLAIHERLLADHGGATGIRDRGLLDSALARPLNLEAYDAPDIFQAAAAYAHGIVRNHPFVDGNKRVGFMLAFVFLGRNGWDLRATEVDATQMMLALAAGECAESKFADWLRANSVRSKR